MSKQVSSCCQKPLKLHAGTEGTNYYICTYCEQAADPAQPNKGTAKLQDEFPAVGKPWPINCDLCEFIKQEYPDLPGDALPTQHYMCHVSKAADRSTVSEGELRKRILAIDTTYRIDNAVTEFLLPNYYADRLVEFVQAYTRQQVAEACIKELARLHRFEGEGLPLRDYDNITDELIDERIAELRLEANRPEGVERHGKDSTS